jgi:hypothetical protein
VSFEATPSAEAWMKVEAGLSKKNNKVISVAHCSCARSIWIVNSNLALHHRNRSGSTQAISQTEANTESTSTGNELSIPVQAETEKKNLQQNEHKSFNKLKTRSTKVAVNTITEQAKEKEEVALVIDQNIMVTETISVTKAEKPIVIEFTLEAITTDTQQVAQASEEKNNGLKKIFDKALELKNGESDFGSLRDAKNELFALDFRKDKTKRN